MRVTGRIVREIQYLGMGARRDKGGAAKDKSGECGKLVQLHGSLLWIVASLLVFSGMYHSILATSTSLFGTGLQSLLSHQKAGSCGTGTAAMGEKKGGNETLCCR
jgi:hypothetical protein